jgi:large subunit ribosomal protein L22
VDNLYVKLALANDGPRMKRIRPAPMGRAFRYQRRLTHIVLSVAEREAAPGMVTKAEEPPAAGKTRPAAEKVSKPAKATKAATKAKAEAPKATKAKTEAPKTAVKSTKATKKKAGK